MLTKLETKILLEKLYENYCQFINKINNEESLKIHIIFMSSKLYKMCSELREKEKDKNTFYMKTFFIELSNGSSIMNILCDMCKCEPTAIKISFIESYHENPTSLISNIVMLTVNTIKFLDISKHVETDENGYLIDEYYDTDENDRSQIVIKKDLMDALVKADKLQYLNICYIRHTNNFSCGLYAHLKKHIQTLKPIIFCMNTLYVYNEKTLKLLIL